MCAQQAALVVIASQQITPSPVTFLRVGFTIVQIASNITQESEIDIYNKKATVVLMSCVLRYSTLCPLHEDLIRGSLGRISCITLRAGIVLFKSVSEQPARC